MRRITGNKRIGITLNKILSMVVILSLLTIYDIHDVTGGGDQKQVAAVELIENIETALTLYRLHNGFYPTTEQGLEALVTKPTMDPVPKRYIDGGYLTRVPIDPWGNPYIYRSQGTDGPIYIISCGPDGVEGTEDDVVHHNEDVVKERVERNIEKTSQRANAAHFWRPVTTPKKYKRFSSLTIGDLPEDNDSSSVLRNGRIITVTLTRDINSEIPSEGRQTLYVVENINDDSGQLLLYGRTRIPCLYKITEEKDKIKINITAMGIYLDTFSNIFVKFSDPPLIIADSERATQRNKALSSSDMYRIEEEFLRLREQLFLSPVMSAELVLDVESEDRTSDQGKVLFRESASRDRTAIIEAGYRVNLLVEKDILFSGDIDDPKSIVYYETLVSKESPQIFISGDSIIITDITEENKDDHIMFLTSLRFRELKYIKRQPMGIRFITHISPRFLREVEGDYMKYSWPNEDIQVLWNRLYDELSDAADPERYKIPYAFAFNLTQEEHIFCETYPDEVLSIVQEKEAVLTWISQEIQWGDKLRIRYLRDYIRILKENGYVDWAETVENLEGNKYLYDFE